MENQVFCFQCEQTAGCSACTGKMGVCGKTAHTAKLQDQLTGALIGLVRATEGNQHKVSDTTDRLVIKGLFTTLTNVNFNDDVLETMIEEVRREKVHLVPDCGNCGFPCGRNEEYDMEQLWKADEDIRSLKSLLLFGIWGIAAYAFRLRFSIRPIV